MITRGDLALYNSHGRLTAVVEIKSKIESNFVLELALDQEQSASCESILNRISARLLSAAELIPLEASVLDNASRYQSTQGFSPQDSSVYASIISHLHGWHERQSYFLSRDSDLDDDDVVNELVRFNRKIVHSFACGCQFITRDLTQKAGSK